ncbi:SpoIIIAH-like family protein [Fuchsiella alkaliacetigena]|uniref:SpoIIIAH-like family protein n=1 Tax=Fuchsiella alkaliacetigena TaxID=957042 RepID=UPI00200B9ACD|nr:SpoIIIAH-like family protein [Fuchsiella alkaliacetigena]MCK8825453.1 SpoIIIAH-like family protein [Fuchsiella alkaliacetigena]
MSIFVRKKMVWFLVLMLWVGMVTGIVIYNADDSSQVEIEQMAAEEEEEKEVEEAVSEVAYQESDLNSLEGKSVDVAKVSEKVEEEGADFFVEYRLERDKVRSEQVSLLREMINNPNSSEALKDQAQDRLLDMTNTLEKEMEIESLIRARGFEDALSFIHRNSVDIIIATPGLEESDVAKIGDVVAKATGLGLEDVTIIEKNFAE